jgi:hypothetical protein
MPDQPSVADRAFDADAVFVDAAAGAQERQVDQLDMDAHVLDRCGRVRNLDQLARRGLRISEWSFSGEFDGLYGLR